MIVNDLEQSYLKHILIAAELRDYSAPFRTFFDNWFAFKVGGPFLNANSRPHWFNNPCPDRHGEALRRAHFVSVAAARTLGGFVRDRLVKDHAVPVALLRDLLFDEQPRTIEEIRAFLLRHYRIGIITQEEDERLRAAGLRSRMPEDWRREESPFGRYEQVGIVAQDQGYSASAVRPSAANNSSRPVSRFGRLLGSSTSAFLWEGRQNG